MKVFLYVYPYNSVIYFNYSLCWNNKMNFSKLSKRHINKIF